jgi:hypothetical protein
LIVANTKNFGDPDYALVPVAGGDPTVDERFVTKSFADATYTAI